MDHQAIHQCHSDLNRAQALGNLEKRKVTLETELQAVKVAGPFTAPVKQSPEPNFRSLSISSIVNILNGILSLPLIIGSAYYYGIIGVVISLAIINFSIWLCSAVLLRKELLKNQLYFTLKGLRKHFNTLYHFSLPSFLSTGNL